MSRRERGAKKMPVCAAGSPASCRGQWLPRYERAWLRADVAAGIAVTALVVPKNLGYAEIAGVPLQNGLYAAAAGAIIYALFCTSRHISTGPSSSLAAVAGGAVLVAGLGGEQAAQLVAAITLATGAAVPAAGAVADGMDRPVPLEGGDHRVPGRRRDRRRDRGAAQAHRHVGRGRQRVARARVVARHARRGARGRPCSSASSRSPSSSACVARAGGSGRARAGRRRPARLVRVRPRRARGRAGRRRAARAARARAARSGRSSATTTRPSASPRSRCC